MLTGEHVGAVAVPDQAAQPVVLHEPEQVEAAAVHRQDRHRAVPQPPGRCTPGHQWPSKGCAMNIGGTVLLTGHHHACIYDISRPTQA